MSMKYEELDERTRSLMLSEFEAEEASGNPYRSRALSPEGLSAFPNLMREAIRSGNEDTLFQAINRSDYWIPTEPFVREGKPGIRKRNIPQSAERLAVTEFSTWYVKGFAKRLLEEGIESCQVYRGEFPKWEPGECSVHEGQIVATQAIYDSHRTRYWPEPGRMDAFSIPFGPGCHHLIRRIPR